MREMEDAALVAELVAYRSFLGEPDMDLATQARLEHAMPGLKLRAKTLRELLDSAYYIFSARPLDLDARASRILDEGGRDILVKLTPKLRDASDWCNAALEDRVRTFASENALKLGAVAQPLRAALTGRGTSPGVFDVMETLGAEECLARLEDQARRD